MMNNINYGGILRVTLASLKDSVQGMVDVSKEFDLNPDPKKGIEDIELCMKGVNKNLRLLEMLIKFYKEVE